MPEPFAPFNITICGIDELEGHCGLSVSHVLSILNPGHPEPKAFAAIGQHKRLTLRFHDIIAPTAGFIEPTAEDVEQLLAFGRTLPEGANLLVHCHKGTSRSTAAAALILAQAQPDAKAGAIFEEVMRIRLDAWPSIRLIDLGDAQLGRRQALTVAVRACYRAYLARHPEWREKIVAAGRGRELEGL